MAPSPLQHRRTHNTLLFQKLLNLKDGASPFTLLLDSLEQGGKSVVREFVKRGKVRSTLFFLIARDQIFLISQFLFLFKC